MGKLRRQNIMKLRKAYVDIESSYIGDYSFDKPEDKNLIFKDYINWVFSCEKECDGKKIEHEGIIGILIVDFEVDDATKVHRIVDSRLVQLIGKDCCAEILTKELEGINEVVSYHGRTKPNYKGYTGYDFGVIAANTGIILDELPGVKSIDLELDCQIMKLYGGLKKIECRIPGMPPRKSRVEDGSEAEKILYDIAHCDDKNKKAELWEKLKQYNKEDIIALPIIEKYVRDVKIVGTILDDIII